MTSLWHEHPQAPRAALPGDAACDVVVVGAGITGLLTAVQAARAGLSVIVLEARSAGAATTGNSTAKVSLLQGTRLRRIRRGHPLSIVQSYVDANRGLPVASCLVDGVRHEVSAVCPHLHGIVAWNDAENSWDCPLHGSRFAPDGSVLEGPTTQPLAPR